MATLSGVGKPATNTPLASTMGTLQAQASTLDPKALTLSLTPQIGTPGTSLSWNSDAPISSFGKPDPFSTDLSAGGLTASEPIQVPAGPGNFTPTGQAVLTFARQMHRLRGVVVGNAGRASKIP